MQKYLPLTKWIIYKQKTSYVNRLSFILLIIINILIICHAYPFTESNPLDRCTGAADIGDCTSFVHKWYFNNTAKKCLTFIYGGCGGNILNRFDSEIECLHYCVSEDHTLPPALTSTPFDEKNYFTLGTNKTYIKGSSPIPPNERGKELTFQETGKHKTFMFAESNTFIQLDGDIIQTFQLRLCREISFEFRTRLPHGLLVYHNVKVPNGIKLEPYALYVIVQKGQLKVVHVFGRHLTALTVGRGLNRNEWHSVTVRIDVHLAKLIAVVDNIKEEVSIKGLHEENNYGISESLPSVVLIGGLSSEEKLHGVKYIIESFVGCIRNMVLSAGKAASDLITIQPLIATKHENVKEGCTNLCYTDKNLCFVGSHCINHYNTYTCDCFGTHYEGEQCDIYTATVLTLRGSSYVSYRVYDWKDRVHSANNRISLLFKTRFDDSALFYASGEIDGIHHYIAASIKNHIVRLEFDFGEGMIKSELGTHVTINDWNNLTIVHDHKTLRVSLNKQVKLLDIPGNMYHLYIDPEIYIGGGPELQNKKGLATQNNFVGSLKYVFFNDISIIYELKKQNPKVHYIGVLEPELEDIDVDVIPITYPFASSHIWWPNNQTDSLSLTFDFKSSRSLAVLASSDVTTESGLGYWEIRAVNDEIRFELVPDAGKNITHLTSVKYEPDPSSWHIVEVSYSAGELKLAVDFRTIRAQLFGLKFQLGDKVIVGSGLRGNAPAGLIGCMRKVTVNGAFIEPRYVVQTERLVGEVAIDDCRFIDPCHRPNTCEHNGKCSVKEDHLTCDCKGTGYIGKNCHFAEFRKTCEELALLGYTKPDVYLIDIDGNGRFPPAHVRCEFQSLEDSTKTIVEHNLPSQVDVRSAGEDDFSFNIKYREFTAEMLQELISHSLYCSQYIKYDCYKAPLELHSATWFISSFNNYTVDQIGDSKRGTCPCAVNKTCENPSEWCNCDITEGKWNSDEGYYTSQKSLGITQMIFLQQSDLEEDAQGRITLGPLECVETNTQKYVVTFTTSQSYIEVPGWRKGDLAFSFRTTGEKAILLYQPPIRPNYPSFMVALTSDYQLMFNFTLNTGTSRGLVIKSGRKLNEGEWHKLWIDYNQYHVRFMINTDYEMVDLRPEEEFGPFEGSMFIGGAPSDLLKKSSVTQGLIGCFRGLVVNGEILDIYSYMSVHLSEIIKDCKPSCVPNPCKNGARCKELWSTFQCVCENPWAHLGPHCETNININALTFISPEAYLKNNYLTNQTSDDKTLFKSILYERILINLRTYDNTSLVLYANDHINNFVHIYINNGTELTYLFNYGNEIKNITIDYPKLNSGETVQIAILRNENSTILHVNNYNRTIPFGVLLLEEYSNKPWINSEKEVLAPPRPPAPPTDYFQLNLGGYDQHSLLKMSAAPENFPGYVGCIRGFQIGETLIDLPTKAIENVQIDTKGVILHCQMKCDATPCKHQGICVEDFRRQEHTCLCEHTSYYGEFCDEEKGADFNGESMLQRKFVLKGEVHEVKVQLAFSSNDLRKRSTVLLLLQTENIRSYYLLVALTPEGHLIFEEDREGSAYGIRISDRDFLNGARHSVYYKRVNDTAELRIDRQSIPLNKINVLGLSDVPDIGSDEVQIGGLNTTDPRFAIYKGYNGCLSNVFVLVNGLSMKPLEEYMMFKKIDAEKVNVTNSQGVRSAQCNDHFDIIHKVPAGPTLNISHGLDKAWVEDPPARMPYRNIYADASIEKDETGTAIFIALTTFFVVIVLGSIYEVYRSDRQYRRRQEMETDASIIRSKEQAAKQMQGVAFAKSDEDIPPKPTPISNGISKNGGILSNSTAQFIPIPTSESQIKERPTEKRATFKDDIQEKELAWEPDEEKTELLNEDEMDFSPPQSRVVQPTIIPTAGPRSKVKAPPPHKNPLSTQLPYKIDEMAGLEYSTSAPA